MIIQDAFHEEMIITAIQLIVKHGIAGFTLTTFAHVLVQPIEKIARYAKSDEDIIDQAAYYHFNQMSKKLEGEGRFDYGDFQFLVQLLMHYDGLSSMAQSSVRLSCLVLCAGPKKLSQRLVLLSTLLGLSTLLPVVSDNTFIDTREPQSWAIASQRLFHQAIEQLNRKQNGT